MGQSAPDSDDRHHLRDVPDSVLRAAGALFKRAFPRVLRRQYLRAELPLAKLHRRLEIVLYWFWYCVFV